MNTVRRPGSTIRRGVVAILAVIAALGSGASARSLEMPHDSARSPEIDSTRQEKSALPRLPLEFEANRGQAAPGVRFLASGPDLQTAILTDRVCFAVAGAAAETTGAASAPTRLTMRFAGSRGAASVVGVTPLPGRSAYYLGSDATKWITGIPHFSGVEQRDVLPGVTARWSAPRGRLKYDLLLAPGTNPNSIRLEFEGATRLAVTSRGDLRVVTSSGELVQSRPVCWQESSPGVRVPVSSGFRLLTPTTIGFRLGRVNSAHPLIIDPWIEYSSYFGNTTASRTDARVATGPDGSVYLAGNALASSFSAVPTTTVFNFHGGNSDIYAVRLQPDLSGIIYAAHIGGSAEDRATGVDVDQDGNVYIHGSTDSQNFPLVNHFDDFGTSMSPIANTMTKLPPEGSPIAYSTHGTVQTSVRHAADLVVNSTGRVHLTLKNVKERDSNSYQTGAVGTLRGTSVSSSPPSQGDTDCGAVLVWNDVPSGTDFRIIIGGAGSEGINGICRDADGNIYVVGTTTSTDIPVVNALQGTNGGGASDAFVAKVDPTVPEFVYLTYLGGSGADEGHSITVDGDGNAYVVGSTTSSNFPTSNALQSTLGGGRDGFVTKLAADGSAFGFSSYLGGASDDAALDAAFSPGGFLFVVGSTASTGFPLVIPRQPAYGGGASDGFVMRFDADGAPDFSTFLGGSGEDAATAVDLVGEDVVVGGTTKSTNFPLVNPLVSTTGTTNQTIFVTRYTMNPQTPIDLDALLTDLTAAEARWTDVSDEETGYEVERREGAGPFVKVADLPADSTVFQDPFVLTRNETYGYRVRAVNDFGISAYSNEDEVFSPPIPVLPPSAPSALVVTAQPDGSIDLSWQDNSPDEEQFQINRSVSGGVFSILASVISGTTTFTDTQVLPDRSYSYGVRAVNSIGVSPFTTAVTATTPQSLDLVLTKGLISDSTRFGRDRIVVKATVAVNAASPDGAWDPVADGIRLRLGDEAQAPLFNLGPADEGWIAKRSGKMFWKSPRESLSKAKILYDPATGALAITLSKLTFVTPPANPVLIWLGGANDAGHFEGDWFLRRVGLLKYPVPVPK